jgi:hypothetical protein
MSHKLIIGLNKYNFFVILNNMLFQDPKKFQGDFQLEMYAPIKIVLNLQNKS